VVQRNSPREVCGTLFRQHLQRVRLSHRELAARIKCSVGLPGNIMAGRASVPEKYIGPLIKAFRLEGADAELFRELSTISNAKARAAQAYMALRAREQAWRRIAHLLAENALTVKERAQVVDALASGPHDAERVIERMVR